MNYSKQANDEINYLKAKLEHAEIRYRNNLEIKERELAELRMWRDEFTKLKVREMQLQTFPEIIIKYT